MSKATEQEKKPTFRKFREGAFKWANYQDDIFNEDTSHKCPTYVNRTPPCQGSCPSGEDIRGWLQIIRGIEKPPVDMSWQEYAFRRSTDANPFPSMMGRVCPAPCEAGCNRNIVDDFVGINAVEQFIGDTAVEENFRYETAPPLNQQRVAVIGGGPAGLAAAYQLRRKGYGSVIIERQAELGGMFRYGIPGYRTPRSVLDHEIQRILDLDGIEVRLNTRVGTDITVQQLENDYDAIIWAIGCQSGNGLPLEGWDGAPNCVSGVAFLEAFNKGHMKVTAEKVVCVGGGDTSIDVVSVARRLGKIVNINQKDRPEEVIGGYTAHDAAMVARRQGCDVTLTALFKRQNMTASEIEVEDATTEGVNIIDGVMPVEILIGDTGRAVGLKMTQCEMDNKGAPVAVEGTEFELEADLIVSAIGQGGDLEGIEDLGNQRNLINADPGFRVPDRPGHFVAGDIVRPHLLTTAIGQASIAAASAIGYMAGNDPSKRPRVDVHHFNLLNKLNEQGLKVSEYDKSQVHGTDSAGFAVHNYEDRSANEIIPADDLFLAHFKPSARNKRTSAVPDADQVLGNFEERHMILSEEQAVAESKRCMSCGMCFECNNCVIYCPQIAVFRVKKDKATLGRYVDTDYSKCIGCHICADVCPSGYIDMGLGK